MTGRGVGERLRRTDACPAPRRHDARQHGGNERQCNRKQQHTVVQSNRCQRRNVSRCEPHDQSRRAVCHTQAQDAAEPGKQECLGEQLTNEAAAIGAERAANADLACARLARVMRRFAEFAMAITSRSNTDTARTFDRRSQVPGQMAAKGYELNRLAAIGARILLGEALGDAIELRLSLLDRDSWLEPRDGVEIAGTAQPVFDARPRLLAPTRRAR